MRKEEKEGNISTYFNIGTSRITVLTTKTEAKAEKKEKNCFMSVLFSGQILIYVFLFFSSFLHFLSKQTQLIDHANCSSMQRTLLITRNNNDNKYR